MDIKNATDRLYACVIRFRTELALVIAPWLNGEGAESFDRMSKMIIDQSEMIEALSKNYGRKS